MQWVSRVVGAWVFGLALTVSAQAANVTEADGLAQFFPFSDQIEVLRGPANSLDTTEVLAGRRDAEFARPHAQGLKCHQGIVCWVRFTVARSPQAPPTWWLRVRAVRPGEVMLFVPHGKEATVLPPRQLPLNWRFVTKELFFAVPLGTRPTTYYLRLEHTLSVDGFSLLQDAGLERQQRQFSTYLNISAGATVALLMLNLIFWRWLRDRLFVYFALVMLSAVLLHAWQIVPSLWTPERVGDLSLRGALQSLFQATTALFVSRLFEFRRHLPGAARTVGVFVALNVLTGALALVGYHASIEPVTSILEAAALTGTIGAAGWLLFIKRQWQFTWPAVLMLLLAAASLVGRLRWMGVLDAGPDEGLGPTWTAVRLAYMMLLAIIVADRTRRAELQVRWARRRELDNAQRAERVLEEKVQERTAELGKSNALLAEEIDRRRRAEAGLEAALASERSAMQQQRQFVSLVSHEFRTPLAVIDAAAQSIALPGVAVEPRIAKIRRAVHRLTLLVVNCLAEDRLQTDRALPRAETIDLKAVVEGLASPFGRVDQARIRIHLPSTHSWVHADPALLEIALHNLVQNAIKYSPPDSAIDIRLAVQDNSVSVDVEDRGTGIPEAEHARIFERFFRGVGSRLVSGTGLGLFLGADIARAHGGSITLVRSTAQGSLFRFCMPLAPGVS